MLYLYGINADKMSSWTTEEGIQMKSNFPPTDYDSVNAHAKWAMNHKRDKESWLVNTKCDKLIVLLISMLDDLENDKSNIEHHLWAYKAKLKELLMNA